MTGSTCTSARCLNLRIASPRAGRFSGVEVTYLRPSRLTTPLSMHRQLVADAELLQQASHRLPLESNAAGKTAVGRRPPRSPARGGWRRHSVCPPCRQPPAPPLRRLSASTRLPH